MLRRKQLLLVAVLCCLAAYLNIWSLRLKARQSTHAADLEQTHTRGWHILQRDYLLKGTALPLYTSRPPRVDLNLISNTTISAERNTSLLLEAQQLAKLQRLKDAADKQRLKQALCAAFRPAQPLSTVAVVGEEPLSDREAEFVEEADFVIRVNKLTHWQPGQGRLDLWITWYRWEATSYHYLGLNGSRIDKGTQAIEAAKHVWLVGGYDFTYKQTLERYLLLRGRHPVHVERYVFELAYAQWYSGRVQSAEFMGLMAAIRCTAPSVRIHAYGFQWPAPTSPYTITDNLQPLYWRAEERAIHRLHTAGMIELHPTQCLIRHLCGVRNYLQQTIIMLADDIRSVIADEAGKSMGNSSLASLSVNVNKAATGKA